MIEFNFDSDFFNSEIDNLIADDLSNQFNELIDERDSIIDSEGYNVTTIEAKKNDTSRNARNHNLDSRKRKKSQHFQNERTD